MTSERRDAPGRADDDDATLSLGDESVRESSVTWDALIEQLASYRSPTPRYEDEGEFARGGMGQLRRVFDKSVRRRLAMKVLLDQKATDADSSARSLGHFLEEAQVTGQLDHPGIVPVHELGVDEDGRVYFTMKLVRGEDLRAVFDRVADPSDAEWTTTRALSVLLRVCEAMAYAHAKGVVHRDLKPANVMVGRYGEAYVMDWGLAKVLGREDTHDVRLETDPTSSLRSHRKETAAATPDSPLLTMDGDVVGTPAYMPPEQAEGRTDLLGPPADVYAMGAILYQLLAGHMPYVEPGQAISARTVLGLVLSGPPAPVAARAPDARPELIAICEKSMARRIEDRYPDMTALARDLRAYLEHRVVAAYEAGAWAELRKWLQRNRALARTAAAALVAIVALAGWALVERQTSRANEQVALAKESEAERNRARAEAERDRVLRLSDRRHVEMLVAETETLWPEHPEKVDAMRDWLRRAEALLEHLPRHESTLAEARVDGTPLPHPREPELASMQRGPESDEERAALARAIERERDHDFGADVQARWWHDLVRDLVVGLHALRADDAQGATLAGMRRRIEWAESVGESTITGRDAAARWEEARVAIRRHPAYGGLELSPQIGFVPLGPDPASTLWEFGHLRTGVLPDRDSATGALRVDDQTGLVFVLIPGGTVRVGAQRDDAAAPHYDPRGFQDDLPVQEVALDPFFLSKYEMTLMQWVLCARTNPMHMQPVPFQFSALRNPVNMVSWDDGRETLFRLGLTLPTEVQWEAACRAGTTTPWWTGRRPDSLGGAANLADRAGPPREAATSVIALVPVGAARANPFGLHDVHGNVAEWCRDAYAPFPPVAPRPGDGLIDVPDTLPRVYRGGSFSDPAWSARSAGRSGYAPEPRLLNVGVRPARRVR